jgi:hypothetical protein
MPALRENAITRLVTVTGISLNTAAKQTLFTVPTSKSAIITAVILRNVSAPAATATAGFGGDTPATDFRAAFTLAGLVAAGDGQHIEPLDGGTLKTYAAGALFGIDMGTLVAATVDVEVYGYLI